MTKGLDSGSQHTKAALDAIVRLYKDHEPKQIRPSLSKYLTTIKTVLSSFKRVFIIIDALDEMKSSSEREIFQDGINRLACFEGKSSILITSRPQPEITVHFHDNLQLEITAKSQDLETYLENQIKKKSKLRRLNKTDRGRSLLKIIVTKITEKAQGMYVFA